MGQASIYIVVSAIAVAALLFLSMSTATSDADERLNDYQYKDLARDAALTGLNMTVRKLAADTNDWNINPSQYSFTNVAYKGGGTFTVEVGPCAATATDPCAGGSPDDVVNVAAVGTHGIRFDAQTGTYVPVIHRISARYKRQYVDGIPPAFRNVMTAHANLTLPQDITIQALTTTFNASVHTNGILGGSNSLFRVDGYGTYAGGVQGVMQNNFTPNVDYNGSNPNVFWADTVRFPAISQGCTSPKCPVNVLQQIAQTSGVYIDSSYTFDGFTTPVIDLASWADPSFPSLCGSNCGTSDNPLVIFVDDTLRFSDRVQFRGYGVIVSTEDISIAPGTGSTAGVMGELNTTFTNSETQVLLGTTKNIHISGVACMGWIPGFPGNSHCHPSGNTPHGITLYAEGSITFQGFPYLVGGVVARTIAFQSLAGEPPEFIYTAPSVSITSPVFKHYIPIGPVLVAYSEW